MVCPGLFRVLTMHGNSDALVATLREHGIDAAPLHTEHPAAAVGAAGEESTEATESQ